MIKWIKLLTDKDVSKTPFIMDIRWIFCNHIMRLYGDENTWDRKIWTEYLLSYDGYSILDMIKVFIKQSHTRNYIIELLMEPNDKRYTDN